MNFFLQSGQKTILKEIGIQVQEFLKSFFNLYFSQVRSIIQTLIPHGADVPYISGFSCFGGQNIFGDGLLTHYAYPKMMFVRFFVEDRAQIWWKLWGQMPPWLYVPVYRVLHLTKHMELIQYLLFITSYICALEKNYKSK